MADVTLSIGGHSYTLACRDGEEAHLLNMGALIDAKTVEARAAVGGLSEIRQLVFAALLLADELSERRAVPTVTPASDASSLTALVGVAERLEAIASTLEDSRH